MLMTSKKQDLIKYNNYPPVSNTNFLSQFTNWAKIWMSSTTHKNNNSKSKIPRKRKINSTSSQEELIINGRETDIRCRINYYDQSPRQTLVDLTTSSQRAFLYRVTCQKLRPITTTGRKLVYLGDILHVRKFWDNLEILVYQELSNTSHYVPPTKRIPFHPDKPGSIYLPRKKRNIIITHTKPPRKSFASSTIVYTKSLNRWVSSPVQQDDDDVPLGALHFSFVVALYELVCGSGQEE